MRLEVMQTIEKSMAGLVSEFLLPIEENWQPSDILPDSKKPDFFEQVQELQAEAKEMSYDLLAVLIGDAVTEEALPTYESWLVDIAGIEQDGSNGWSKWVRGWTSEETRHGDLLSKYLYLSGRVNMREVEISTQYLLKDGFDIQTSKDPYRNFVYTSFQETATNISHRRVASLAQQCDNRRLAKLCGTIAADEMRHANAYMSFVKRIYTLDPNEMMLAFADMMKRKIAMPAHFMRESGGPIGGAFTHFMNAAQRTGVYTTQDHIGILKSLLLQWDIEKMGGLNDSAQKARDYLMALPKRLERISRRFKTPETQYDFKWIARGNCDKNEAAGKHTALQRD